VHDFRSRGPRPAVRTVLSQSAQPFQKPQRRPAGVLAVKRWQLDPVQRPSSDPLRGLLLICWSTSRRTSSPAGRAGTCSLVRLRRFSTELKSCGTIDLAGSLPASASCRNDSAPFSVWNQFLPVSARQPWRSTLQHAPDASIDQLGAVHAYMIAADCFSSTCWSPPCKTQPFGSAPFGQL
jgi:hypothetical protein